VVDSDHECRVCLDNFFFYGVLGVGITTVKFASQVVKFCCKSTSVKDCVSKMRGLSACWSVSV